MAKIRIRRLLRGFAVAQSFFLLLERKMFVFFYDVSGCKTLKVQ